ncbi:hypothetical protein [Effusibacillus consociatus]|uniref:Uncharacterized protein n=1 Tax=Effusibacillus consociatus TaxID=1117041 RepID=A0ABV9Q0X4_9BACL
MGFMIWVIAAIAIAVIRNAMKRGFPKLPDGRHDTPLGPRGHRQWPAKPPITEQPVQPRTGTPMASGRPGETITGREREAMTPTMSEGRSEYETRDPVSPTLREPHETVYSTLDEPHETVHETVRVSTAVRPAPEYRNEKRARPSSDTERAFSGQSSYDRIGTHPVGRPVRRQSPFSIQKGDLVRAVVMAEILGPPRARKGYSMKSRWGKR